MYDINERVNVGQTGIAVIMSGPDTTDQVQWGYTVKIGSGDFIEVEHHQITPLHTAQMFPHERIERLERQTKALLDKFNIDDIY